MTPRSPYLQPCNATNSTTSSQASLEAVERDEADRDDLVTGEGLPARANTASNEPIDQSKPEEPAQTEKPVRLPTPTLVSKPVAATPSPTESAEYASAQKEIIVSDPAGPESTGHRSTSTQTPSTPFDDGSRDMKPEMVTEPSSVGADEPAVPRSVPSPDGRAAMGSDVNKEGAGNETTASASETVTRGLDGSMPDQRETLGSMLADLIRKGNAGEMQDGRAPPWASPPTAINAEGATLHTQINLSNGFPDEVITIDEELTGGDGETLSGKVQVTMSHSGKESTEKRPHGGMNDTSTGINATVKALHGQADDALSSWSAIMPPDRMDLGSPQVNDSGTGDGQRQASETQQSAATAPKVDDRIKNQADAREASSSDPVSARFAPAGFALAAVVLMLGGHWM